MVLRRIAGIGIHPFGYCAVRSGAFKVHGAKGIDVIGERHYDDPTDIVAILDQALGALSKQLPRQISLSIPLFLIELLSIKIPLVPEEAVDGALAFRLKKAISRDINDYSLDYIETSRDATGIQFEVYLFPRDTFAQLEACVKRHGHTLSHLEPDIFSIFAYLDVTGAISTPEGVMGMAIWPDSISIGILNGDRIRVSRSINLGLPVFKEATSKVGVTSAKVPDYNEIDNEDLLKKFCLLQNGPTDTAHDADSSIVIEMEGEAEGVAIDQNAPTNDPMDDYCRDLVVQIMRTRDYYTSVLKMGQLKKIELFGPAHLRDVITSCLKDGLAIEVDFHGDPLKAAASGASMR